MSTVFIGFGCYILGCLSTLFCIGLCAAAKKDDDVRGEN